MSDLFHLFVIGCILDAELPFSALASCEHTSVEEMRHLVCSKKLRPTLAEHWSQDEVMNMLKALC